MSAAIATHELTRRFRDVVAVDRVSLEVETGEVFGLLGPNGAGKTTLVRLLCGLYAPSGGEAAVLGLDLRRDRARLKARVGYVSQAFGLYEELTVSENVAFFAAVYGASDPARTRTVLERLELGEVAGRQVGTLPTGLRQRTALAATLVHRPELVLLDEPTSGMDPAARLEAWRFVRDLASEGVTALVTTHVMAEAEQCDRLALLADGRLVALGTPRAIVESAGLTVAQVDASPWQLAFRQLKARWPAATLHGRQVRVPLRRDEASDRTLRDALAGCDLGAITWTSPSVEEAFVARFSAAGRTTNPRAPS
ncbi:MAG TPA: ABC transporter ATP-binding protein [Acidimicrobiales bacterium]|jgi:ABC-2 type transport system ATP-binding protein|nr:ABC transporter ATP-binding protein [Acidimicrobiales bacterium]